MSHPLFPCPTCARHIRAGETACPFCQAALDHSFSTRSLRPPPGGRLSRAAIVALGAFAGACGEPELAAPVYGAPAPPEDAAGPDAAGPDTPVYGAPAPPVDAAPCQAEDGGTGDGGARDGGVCAEADANFVAIPVYGAPPPREP